jgi:hypothetical protein
MPPPSSPKTCRNYLNLFKKIRKLIVEHPKKKEECCMPSIHHFKVSVLVHHPHMPIRHPVVEGIYKKFTLLKIDQVM